MLEKGKKTKLSFFMGPGGVGKTSVSSACAVALAKDGKKVLLVSLDPAKRLGTILELDEMDSPKEHPLFGGLFCVQQDTDTLLKSAILNFSSSEQADKIFDHTFYNILRSGISGPTEYMSLFSLYKWWESNLYDHIIIDTAPHMHAVRVLKMPNVIRSFQENGVFRKMILPLAKVGSFGVKIFQGVAGQFPINLFGVQLFRDLAGFLVLMEDTVEGFYNLSSEFQDLLQSELAAFCFVGTPLDQSAFVFDALSAELSTMNTGFSQAYLNKTLDGECFGEGLERDSFFGKTYRQQKSVVEKLRVDIDSVHCLPTVSDIGASPLNIVRSLADRLSLLP